MTIELESKAEVAKLARLLDADPDSLAFLERVPPEDLRVLRDQATDVLFDADLGALQRMAAASRVIPVPLLAKIAEGVFGPLLCARIAGLIDPPRAVDIAARLEPAFLADVAVSLDPRRATDVIARMPVEQIVAVASELLSREEFVTMGRFVGHLSEEALSAALALADEAALLRIAFVLEGKERLGDVLGMLSGKRLAAVIKVAGRDDLWAEVLDLLANVSDRRSSPAAGGARRGRDPFATLARVAAGLDVEVLERAALAATKHELWPPLIQLAVLMDEEGQRRVAGVIVAAPDAITDSMFDAVAADRMWPQLLTLALPLEPSEIERLALRGAARIDLGELVSVAEQDARLWEPALRLLAGLGIEVQRALLEGATALSEDRRALIADQAKQLGLESQLEPFARAAH